MNQAVFRYIAGLLLCVLIAVAYAATRKRGWRAVLLDSAFCLGCMLAVIAAVAAAVHLLCELK
jgi:predicted exporter